MLNLLPMRVSKFSEAERNHLLTLIATSREDSDRSQFVRFAKMTQTWLNWVQEGIVVEDQTEQIIEDDDFTYGIALLDDLTPTQSVLPVEKEQAQRIIEALSVHLQPIVINSNGVVLDNHIQYHAAKGLQEEMARPGKVRPTDYAFVAAAKNPIQKETTLAIQSSVPPEQAFEKLKQTGQTFNRSDVPAKIHLTDKVQEWALNLESDGWLQQIEDAFKLRKLDLNLIEVKTEGEGLDHLASLKVTISPDFLNKSGFRLPNLAPAGSIRLDKLPKIGHIMWSSRSFRPRT